MNVNAKGRKVILLKMALQRTVLIILHASKVSMKRIGANKNVKKACNCSEPKKLMDRQWHWDTRLEHHYEKENKQTSTPPTNH